MEEPTEFVLKGANKEIVFINKKFVEKAINDCFAPGSFLSRYAIKENLKKVLNIND